MGGWRRVTSSDAVQLMSSVHHKTVADNPSIRMYVNTTENRITFRIKTGYYLKLLMPETIKLLEVLKIR